MGFVSSAQVLLENASGSLVDVTAWVEPESLVVSQVLGQRLDRLSLELRWDCPVEPGPWREIQIWGNGTILFGGYVMQVRPTDEGGEPAWDVSAFDYGVIFGKRLVTERYEDMYDDQIVAHLVATYAPEMSLGTVERAAFHDRVVMNRLTLAQALDRLARDGQSFWYVDYQKRVHYHRTGRPAPWSVSDTPDMVGTFPPLSAWANRDGAGVVNRVTVVGGTFLGPDEEFILPGTGEDNRVKLPFRLHAPEGGTSIQVWRNDGTETSPSWTPLTVKAGYLDELTGPDEVLYYFQEAVLEQQNPWPHLPNAVRVKGRKDIPVRVVVEDQASQAHFGLVLETKLVDHSLASKSAARMAGRALLARQAFERVALHLEVGRPGLRPGQVLSVSLSRLGISGEYLIQRTTMRLGRGGRAFWQVEAGVYSPDLADLYLELFQAQAEEEYDPNEVLDIVKTEQNGVEVADAYTTAVTSPPYRLAPVDPGDAVFLLDYSTVE